MCAFNANHVRQVRQAKNAAARISAPRAPMAPFIEPRQLTNAIHAFRIWPLDEKKNPLGYHYYATHTLWKSMDAFGNMTEPFEFVCPRTSNWDPIPSHYEPYTDFNGQPLYAVVLDENGLPVSDPVTGQAKTELQQYPVYRERCWACETKQQLFDEGITSADQVTDSQLREWLFGTPYSPGVDSKRGLISTDGEAWHFPVTFKAKIETSVPKPNGKGNKVTYAPANEFLHGDLSLREGKIKDELLRLIELVPDCSHLTFGRWFRLEKKNNGVGVGGYTLTIDPNPQPFEINLNDLRYPNYSSWGKADAKYSKPGKRFSYAQVELVGGDPHAWWVPKLEALDVVVRDDA